MYRELGVIRNLNRGPSKPVWQDVKETVRSLQSQINSVGKHLGKWEERWEYEYTNGGYRERNRYQEYYEENPYCQIGQSCWNGNEGMEETLEKIMRVLKAVAAHAGLSATQMAKVWKEKELVHDPH
ncbi:hypothetical protein M9H77_17699 [Catharanthus roseus]|uniref:Uncharacterized protein n=1 Tax=Catharanthus roseus TaxID=4058 RepID=A0ACC0B5C2_CATRO|nr:hypothetical protein M9H77_17699 [Catharanthus roseus]